MIEQDSYTQEEFLNKFEIINGEMADAEEQGINPIFNHNNLFEQYSDSISTKNRVDIGEEILGRTPDGKTIFKNNDVDDIYRRKPKESVLTGIDVQNKYIRFCEIRKRFNFEHEKGKLFLLKKGEYISGTGDDKKYRGVLNDDIIVSETGTSKSLRILGSLSEASGVAEILYSKEGYPDKKHAYLKNGTQLSKLKDFDYKSRELTNAFDINSFRNLLAKR